MRMENFIAGDTLDFLVSVPDYPPADGWTLKYRLTPQFTDPVQAPITLTATTSGSDYQVQADPTTTAAWKPGAYTWARWVEKVGARQTLDERGQLTIQADPTTMTAGTDTRSHARIVLEAIKAALEDRLSTTQRELLAYTIGSRSKQFDSADSKASLIALKSKYEWLVYDEESRASMAAGNPNPRQVRVRNVRP